MLLTNNEFLILSFILGASASLLGVFVILRKMALVSDALSHVALPGFALALLYGFDPFWGALLFLLLAVFGIVFLEKQYSFALETLVGIFFTAFLALGLLLIPKIELAEALFGDIEKLTSFDFYLIIILGLIVFILTFLSFNKLAQISISKTLAQAKGVDFFKFETLLLFLIALITALGVKFIGTLLMGALIILPAAASKNLSNSLKSMTFLSLILGVMMTIGGVIIARGFILPVGPITILLGAFIFICSLFISRFMLR